MPQCLVEPRHTARAAAAAAAAARPRIQEHGDSWMHAWVPGATPSGRLVPPASPSPFPVCPRHNRTDRPLSNLLKFGGICDEFGNPRGHCIVPYYIHTATTEYLASSRVHVTCRAQRMERKNPSPTLTRTRTRTHGHSGPATDVQHFVYVVYTLHLHKKKTGRKGGDDKRGIVAVFLKPTYFPQTQTQTQLQ